MENFPLAFIIASCDEVYKNNNVLYRLVKPASDHCGVESTDRLVNVVPFRRKYQFRAKCDIDKFVHEILSRPLVLQPVLHFGRGLGSCGACYNEEPWIVMVNQTHPKILSRLQMGLDAAKAAFEKGSSAELKFHFGKAVQRLYQDHLEEKENEEAKGSRWRAIIAKCRFSEWEHADLIIRYHGYCAGSVPDKKENVDMEFNFEDITSDEVMWSQAGSQLFPKPHLSPVTEEEIRQELPTWTINGVSPLQDIGEEVPHSNYTYAKAGTLYESFRKKKRQRNPLSLFSVQPDQEAVGGLSKEELGAVGGVQDFQAIEHDFTHGEEMDKHHISKSSSRCAFIYPQSPLSHTEYQYDGYNEELTQSIIPGNNQNSISVDSHGAGIYRKELNIHNSHKHDSHLPLKRSEIKGHFEADARIIPPPAVTCNRLDNTLPHHKISFALKKQDSDRSTGSTNADSGYCEDGHRSRGDSYDYNDNVAYLGFKCEKQGHEKIYSSKEGIITERGLDNPAFSHHDEVDHALAKHKKMVADIIAMKKPLKIAPNVSSDARLYSPEQISESSI